MKKRKITNLIVSAMLTLTMFSGTIITALGREQPLKQTSSPETREYVNHYNSKNRSILFNDNWKFHRGEASKAESEFYDVSNWENIQLPHDYSLTQDYSPTGEAESGYKLGGVGWYRKTFTLDSGAESKSVILSFDGAYMEAEVYVNGKKVAFHPYGYTAFSVDISDYIRVNGVNSVAVKTNNKIPSSRWYSGSGLYRSVYLHILDKVHVAKEGIVFKTPSLDKKYNSNDGSDVEVVTKVVNDNEKEADIKVKASLYERNNAGQAGSLVKSSDFSDSVRIKAKEANNYTSRFKVVKPRLWSPDHPNLYILKVEVYKGETKLDEVSQEVGFRFTAFDSNQGFSLNGKNLKLKGVCMHHDQGGLGAKAYYDAIDRQFVILKEMGVNAVRVTHNPSARVMKDIANRRGIMLIEEAFDTWTNPKNYNNNDYAKWFNQQIGNPYKLLGVRDSNETWAEYDLKSMIRSGINDPAIIMWSLGNEIFELTGGENVANYNEIAKKLVAWVEEVDKSRPVTFGDNKLKDNHRIATGIADMLTNKTGLKGIVGFNYAKPSYNHYETAHRNHPNWIIYGSETASAINSRGVYDVKGNMQRRDKQLTAYDQNAVQWGETASAAWYDVIKRDYVAGEFVWTGFDYLGEPTPWNHTTSQYKHGWPAPKSSYFGIVDTAGFPKDSYYFYQSQWNDKKTTLHILPAWSDKVAKKNGKVEVVVYSNAAKVQLIHTDTNGKKTVYDKKGFKEITTAAGHKYRVAEDGKSDKDLYLTWEIPYVPGKLEAVAYDKDGNVISKTSGRKEVATFDEAAKLEAKVVKEIANATNQSLAYVEIDVKDARGNLVADAANKVSIEVTGPAKLVAMDNGNAVDVQSYQDNNRTVFNGKVLAIIQMTGQSGLVRVTAKGQGLQEASAAIDVKAANLATDKQVESYLISKIYYLKKGNEIKLPKTIKVRYTDQSEEEAIVNWELNSEVKEKLQAGQNVEIGGVLKDLGIKVVVQVIVIDQMVTMKNYSNATPIGVVPELPTHIQAYLMDGSLIATPFKVEWQKPKDNVYNQEGLVTIKGTANVLGEKVPVKATIRVAKKDQIFGGNAALVARLSQDIPKELWKDNLNAINDGKTDPGNYGGGGDNPNIWSNYAAAQAGHKESSITFTYDTAKNISEVIAYYYTDSYSARVPKEVRFSWSRGAGSSFETITGTVVGTPEVQGNVVKTVYQLAEAVPAVEFKLTLVNSEEKVKADHACVALSEVELIAVRETFNKFSDADLDSMLINGQAVSQAVLKNKSIDTDAQIAEVVADAGKKNAAITILPAYKNVIKVISVAEDQSKENVYLINLDKEIENSNNEANDIDPKTTIVSAGATEARPGNETTNATDGDPKTIWHSPWSGTGKENFWLMLELKTETLINGIRYLPRSDYESNGNVRGYEVYVSKDKQTWTKVASGSWDESRDWKVQTFNSIKAKFIKLKALTTYGTPENKYMCAAEFRVSQAPDKTEIKDEHVKLLQDTYVKRLTPIDPKVEVKVDGKLLRKGIDYKLVVKDNTEVGKATVTIKGIGKYRGSIVRYFNIIELDTKAIDQLIKEIEILKDSDYENLAEVKKEIAKIKQELQEASDQETVAKLLKRAQTAKAGLIVKKPEKPSQPQQDIIYKMLAGNNQKSDGNNNLIFRSEADFKKFKAVLVDGKEVEAKNYSVWEGSTIVELKKEFIRTLTKGKHTFSILSQDGKAEAVFEVIKVSESKKPIKKKGIKTGDSTYVELFIGLFLLSLSTLAIIVRKLGKHS